MKSSFVAPFLALLLAWPSQAADLSKLITEAARYESGVSLEPLRKIEQLVLESAAQPQQRAEAEGALIQLLVPGATYEARRFACQQLMIAGTEASLPALAELLQADETAGIACLALGAQDSPKAAEILRKALPGSGGQARLQLIGALGYQRDAQSISILAGLARHTDTAVAEAAILALGKIPSPPSREMVLALAKETRPDTFWAVREALQRHAEHLSAAGDRKGATAIYEELARPSHPIHVRRGALTALLRLDEDGGEQRIVAVLNDSDASLRPVAIAAIGSLNSARSSDKFVETFPKLGPAERVFMIEALANRMDAAARAALRNALASRDAEVRYAAIRGVGRREDSSAVPFLAKALQNAASTQERELIEHALAGLQGGAGTDQAIVAELKSASPDVKSGLCSALALRVARAAVPALLLEATGADTPTARAAFRALGMIAGPEDLPAVLDAVSTLRASSARSEAEDAAARVIEKVPDVSRRSDVIHAYLGKTSDVASRSSLLRLLPNAADAKSLATLNAARRDEEPAVREAAMRALAAWPDIAAWNSLMTVYRAPERETHRTLALRALVRLAGELNSTPNADLIGRYRQLMAGVRSDADRKLILGALAGAAHPGALELANTALAHPGVRAEAELAIRKIQDALKEK